jgi:hypothetical protein
MAVTDEQRTFDAVRSAVQCKVFKLVSCFSEILDTAYDGADSISCLPDDGTAGRFLRGDREARWATGQLLRCDATACTFGWQLFPRTHTGGLL